MAFLAFLLIVFAVVYGAYANPFWKQRKDLNNCANGIFRALIGIPAWAALICLLMKNYENVFNCLLLTAAAMALPVLRMKQCGKMSVRNVFMLVMASLGVYARIVLIWTLLGIPVARYMKTMAEEGIDAATAEWVENMRDIPHDSPSLAEEKVPFTFPNYVVDKAGNQYSHCVSYDGGATYIGPNGEHIFLKPYQIDGYYIR